jgi:hypothetical protein
VKRSAAFAVFSTLLVAATILLFLPVSLCPDCEGWTHGKDAWVTGCPRCSNGGKASLFNRWTRPAIPDDLALLLRIPARDEYIGPDPGPAAARRLLKRAGLKADFLEDYTQACAVWLDDGEERLPAVLLVSRETPPARWGGGVYLLDAGGAVLDDVDFAGCRVDFVVNSRHDPKLRRLRGFTRPQADVVRVRRKGVPVDWPPGDFEIRLRNGAFEVAAEAGK